MTQTFVHFGTGTEPRQTLQVPHRTKPRQSWPVQGDAMPSVYQVRVHGSWRRVWYVWRRACGDDNGNRYQSHFIRDARGRMLASVTIAREQVTCPTA